MTIECLQKRSQDHRLSRPELGTETTNNRYSETEYNKLKRSGVKGVDNLFWLYCRHGVSQNTLNSLFFMNRVTDHIYVFFIIENEQVSSFNCFIYGIKEMNGRNKVAED